MCIFYKVNLLDVESIIKSKNIERGGIYDLIIYNTNKNSLKNGIEMIIF